MEIKWQKMFHLELVPAERILNLWIIYNEKSNNNRGKWSVALPSVICISLL